MQRLLLVGSTAFRGRDFLVGLAAACLTFGLCASQEVRRQGVTMLLAEAAVAIGVLAIVLTAMTVINGFIDGNYRKVLEAVGGAQRAFLPFRVVAFVAAAATVAAIISAVGWPALSAWPRAGLLTLCCGLTAWSVAGVVSLIEIVIFHTEQRALLADTADEAASIQAKRLRERQSPGAL